MGPPRSFERWAEQILVDHPDCKALVLPAGTEIAGDLDLDHDLFAENKISTVAALGPLIIQGRLINADSEGGPFLFVDGDLSARQIEKGGSSFIVLGNVACPGRRVLRLQPGRLSHCRQPQGFGRHFLRPGDPRRR